MASLSKQLLASLDKYFAEIPKHPFIKLHEYSPERKFQVYQRIYNHLVNGADAFSWHYRRAADFAPTPDSRKYLLDIFENMQHGIKPLADDYIKYSCKDGSCDRMGICFALQLFEAELVLKEKDLVLFLVSQLGLLRCVGMIINLMFDEFKENFQWLCNFGTVMDTDVMSEWIDRLAPKEWSQEYFEEMRNVCVKQLVLDFPWKYDYLLTGINGVPQVFYITPNYVE